MIRNKFLALLFGVVTLSCINASVANAVTTPPSTCTNNLQGQNLTVSTGSISGVYCNVGTFTVPSGSTVTVTPYNGTSFGTLTVYAQNIAISGTLSANEAGYRGGAYQGNSAEGPGKGGSGSDGRAGGGGGHGGVGGNGDGIGGITYDSSTLPAEMGSGGGWGENGYNGHVGWYHGGCCGDGGGAIQLFAVNTLSVSGMVTANGKASNSNGGGGSGGSIYLSSASMSGSGTISAAGGASNPGGNGAYGGGGGGGRISYDYANKTGSPTFIVSGGASGLYGAVGAAGSVAETNTTPNPSVVTGAATSVSSTGATLNSNISLNGATGVTAWFEYGTSQSLGTATAAESSTGGAFSQSITNLTPSTQYYYRGVTQRSGGNTTYDVGNSIFTFTTLAPVAPSAPTSLSATAGNNSVSLSWTASTGTVTAYKLYRKTTTSGVTTANTLITCASSTATTCTDSTAVNGTVYYYAVLATNSGSNSALSNEVNATPTLAPPGAPANLIATAGNGEVSLSWGASTGTVTAYKLYRKTPAGNINTSNGTLITCSSSASTSCTDSTTANGTKYYYAVLATNGGADSALSNEVFATPTDAAPNPSVVTTTATGITTTGATLGATVTLNGATNVTAWFEWGSSLTSLTNSTSPQSTTGGAVTKAISGLATATKIYYRAVVQASGGAVVRDTTTLNFTTLTTTLTTSVTTISRAWVGPLGAPPTYNTDIPLSISSSGQTKSGGLHSGSTLLDTVHTSVDSSNQCIKATDGVTCQKFADINAWFENGVTLIGVTSPDFLAASKEADPALKAVVAGDILVDKLCLGTVNNCLSSLPGSGGSGSADMVPKWSSDGLSYLSSDIYNPSGRLAFGSDAATYIAGNTTRTPLVEIRRLTAAGTADYRDANLHIYSTASTGYYPLSIETSSGNALTISNLGYVGIGPGATAPSAQLQVQGNEVVSGTLTAQTVTQSSDIRLKKNISTLTDSLDRVLKLRGVSYEWKDGSQSNQEQLGLIAQEVEKIFPDVVTTDKAGMKSVNYSALIAPMIEGMKEQNTKITKQQSEIDALKSEIESLKRK